MSKTTNVKASDLNYDKYENKKYDRDIVRVIPGHQELHRRLRIILSDYAKSHHVAKIADLGVGTGLTAKSVMEKVPNAKLVAIDFSDQMLVGAKIRLKKYKPDFIVGDYSEIDFGKDFDVITSVIGIHHQNADGKNKLFKKIYDSLKPGGMFLFGDLVTYAKKEEAAYNDAKHYHHLVENAEDEVSLKEWAYHHKYLNDLAPIEYQIEWLRNCGFSSIKIEYMHFNTALIVAIK